ncbi:hypothetical protein ABWH89_13540 [Hoeflea alexandrii]|uniref:hypothetical protein n=1 Tax=Hoeflea alexandrii TaxID=288436 RepID=UPI0035CF449C
MTISPELFMAILSMDSYNRGYDAGISGLSENGGIGNATITTTLSDVSETFEADAQAAGFYAVAYQWNGETVISYRGTDNLIDWTNLNPWSDTPGGDIWNSYLTGLGYTANNQAHLAADFYQAVTGTTDSDPRLSDVTVTGQDK